MAKMIAFDEEARRILTTTPAEVLALAATLKSAPFNHKPLQGPVTVATISWHARQTIAAFLQQTSDDPWATQGGTAGAPF